MQREEILGWLRQDRPDALERLQKRADRVRRERVGDAVHLRAIVEISNVCARRCAYCGLRGPNSRLPRYCMTAAEVLACARRARRCGLGTVVLQAGESDALCADWISDLIRRIKRETDLAITLSLGERSPEELAAWRRAGADRYLLRFETSNAELLQRVHPPRPDRPERSRLALLGELRSLGYEVGSGCMVGLPGQQLADLADDIALFGELDLDMVGLGPYLAHPDTPMGRNPARYLAASEQVPASVEMCCKALALTRLACPDANIPATTALVTLAPEDGLERGLRWGANVFMPNLTPSEYRASYRIYPGKADCADGDPDALQRRLRRLGRTPGRGRGDSPNWLARRAAPSAANGLRPVA
ncbi:MAG: [FeFe] hydrogenase H-cluster radical SAM maturase HydE [Deltaproteobacteria bacterium]|nr:[FeFe] hydrogenase H-cluster radical SAM maturase HydE [Deltaproteobacteria bacterium]